MVCDDLERDARDRVTGEYAGAVLVVTGALTAGLGFGVIVPGTLLRILLGADHPDATSRFIARYCFLLGALVGCLLIAAAAQPALRVAAMSVAAVEKLGFAALVLASPLRYRALTMTFVAIDTVMVLLYALLFFGIIS